MSLLPNVPVTKIYKRTNSINSSLTDKCGKFTFYHIFMTRQYIIKKITTFLEIVLEAKLIVKK